MTRLGTRAGMRLAVIWACCRSMQAGVGLDRLIRRALQTGGAGPKQRSRAGDFTMKFGMVVMAVAVGSAQTLGLCTFVIGWFNYLGGKADAEWFLCASILNLMVTGFEPGKKSMQAGAGCQQLIRKALQLGDAAPKQRSRAGNLITQWGVVLMAVSEEAGSDPAADLWMCCQLLLLLACLCQLGLACFHLHCQNLDSRQQGPTQCLQSIFWVRALESDIQKVVEIIAPGPQGVAGWTIPAAGGSVLSLGPAGAAEALAARLEGSSLKQLGSSPFTWTPKQAYFPKWLFGEWDVKAKLKAAQTPLGHEALPKSLEQGLEPLPGVPSGAILQFRQRWYSTLPDTFANNLKVQVGILPNDAIIADTAFNTKACLNALAGFEAVTEVDFSPREPDRITVNFSNRGADEEQLPPHREELYLQQLHTQGEGDEFVLSRCFRKVRWSACAALLGCDGLGAAGTAAAKADCWAR
eukprot:jgi/Astpho2/7173/fgenesh1_pg.00113_%23_16_t